MNFYYTAREAQTRLGIGVGAFYYLVDTGRIKKLSPPGKARGYYSKHQIEKLAKERTAHTRSDEEAGITFLKATQDDIHEEYELATLLLNGSMGYGLPTYEAWLRYNPDSNFIVRDQGRLVAFMQVLPLKAESIKRWLNGDIREWEIGVDDVLTYEAGRAVECMITSIATTADVEAGERRRYGMRLIRGFLRFLDEQAMRGVRITRFYAASAAPDGLALLRKAKFEERGYIGKRVVFELKSGSAACSFPGSDCLKACLREFSDNIPFKLS